MRTWVLFADGWHDGERIDDNGAFFTWERRSDGKRWQISKTWDDTFTTREPS